MRSVLDNIFSILTQITVTGHEIGHMFGACHDRAQRCKPDDGYEYGYWIPGTRKRTIMA
jgi:hypothetical protein